MNETREICVNCGLPLSEGEFFRCSMCEQLDQERLLFGDDDSDAE